TGLADDADGLFWNPAGLAGIAAKQLTGTQNFSFGGINHETVAYARRLTEKGVGAVSFQGAFAEIERRLGDTEEADSLFTASTYGFGLSYSHALSDLAVGGTLKLLQERFDIENHTGVAIDVGALYNADDYSVGVSVLSLGPELDDSALPLTLRAGGSAMLADDGPLAVADIVLPNDDDLSVRVGLEQWFFDQVALRVGYHVTGAENPNKGFALGLGLKSEGTKSLEHVEFELDYAFIPEDGIADAHRVSFITRF
ncbi:PorV/PorQ family protein, partial [Candidatus Poribacteria bacterium]|nr:PorV/PorQ family protein [Candidatus Poribacteria bacterium]